MRLVYGSIALALVAVTCTSGRAEPPAHRGKPRTVLVELFTSQGCSSCPPAERVLGELGQQAGVVALAYHVDYWNDLGWADRFSSPAWSARQRSYGKRIYTPQLIVNGGVDLVGSRRGDIETAIARARAVPPAGTVSAKVTRAGERNRVAIVARGPVGDDVMVAVVRPRARTRVPRGENAGRELDERYIVLSLERATSIGEDGRASGSISVGSGDVVVFVQDPDSHAVHAVARAVRR